MLILDAKAGIITFVIVLVAAAIIALISFLIYRFLHLKIKQEEKIDEKEVIQEELSRVLEPVEDDQIAKEIADYIDEEDQ